MELQYISGKWQYISLFLYIFLGEIWIEKNKDEYNLNLIKFRFFFNYRLSLLQENIHQMNTTEMLIKYVTFTRVKGIKYIR